MEDDKLSNWKWKLYVFRGKGEKTFWRAVRPDSAAVPAMLVRSFPPLKARVMADTCRSSL